MSRYNAIYNNPYERAKITYAWAFWDNAFSQEELNEIVSYCEKEPLVSGTTFGSSSEEDTLKIRNSKIKFYQRNSDNAWIFDRLNMIIQSINEQYYGFDLNGYDSFQYTTYDSSYKGHYDWHMDMNLGGEVVNQIEPRKLSLSLLLNDEFDGGQFEISTGDQNAANTIDTKKGRAVLFPSFVSHRVKPVTSGNRKSLVVWVVGPKWV